MDRRQFLGRVAAWTAGALAAPPVFRIDPRALAAESAEPVLVIGKGTDYTAVLVRPDMTRFIADGLGELEEDDVRKKFFALKGGSYAGPIDEKHFMEMWLRLLDLKVFFDAAAENMEAVVFTGKLQE